MGAIDTTANRIATTYDSQGNSTVSSAASSGTGATGTPTEAGEIEEGYEQFAIEQNGSTQFDQKTWDTYAQQLGTKVGQDGGSLNAGALSEAKSVAQSSSDTSNQHLLPAGTQLKFEDGSQYTVKPGDTISFESLQQYMPKTETQTQAGTPDAGQFKPVTDPSNALNPANNDVPAGADGTKPRHKDYYADLNSPDNPANPYGLYSSQAMANAMSGTTDQAGSPAGGEEEQKAAALQGKN